MVEEFVMENKQVGIFRLFIIMFFFFVSIFFLNSNKKNFITSTHIDICTIKPDIMTNVSVNHVYQTMNSLFLVHDVDLIIKTISQFNHSFAYELMKKIIQDEVCLSDQEKATIIYGMTTYFGAKKSIQYEWLDLLLDYPSLDASTPVLLTLARSKYADIIGLFITWGKDRQKSLKKNLLTHYAEQAFKKAVEDNDYIAVETLFSKKVRIAQGKACELLWYIVETEKNNALISLLINHAQADVNYTKKGKTLLVAAVEKNSIDMVRILLEKGAIVDRIVDTENTALTIAMKNNYHGVEQLLREYGA